MVTSVTKQRRPGKRLKGCCGLCGVFKNEPFGDRQPHRDLRRMGATRHRRTTRKSISELMMD